MYLSDVCYLIQVIYIVWIRYHSIPYPMTGTYQTILFHSSITCICFLYARIETPILPSMLHPVSVKACLTLPKILSQMITKRPTAFKYCALDIEADKMTVDMCETNVTNLINFRYINIKCTFFCFISCDIFL